MTSLSVSRYEYKYRISGEQLEEIRRYLRAYTTPDAHAGEGGWYVVNSLYLDTDGYQLYRDTVENAPSRFKLRVRTYGPRSGVVKLEIKRRMKDVIRKTSAALPAEQWERAQQGGLLEAAESRNGPRSAFIELVERLRASPKVLVRYERQALASILDDYVRITFDRRMVCQAANGWRLEGDGKGWEPFDHPRRFGERESSYVMELKFAVAPPEWLRDLVTYFGVERSGYSKYARSIQRIAAGDWGVWESQPRLVESVWAGRVA